jgi:hypothetical protein
MFCCRDAVELDRTVKEEENLTYVPNLPYLEGEQWCANLYAIRKFFCINSVNNNYSSVAKV